VAAHQDASTGNIIVDPAAPSSAAAEPLMVDGKPAMIIKIYSPFRVYFDDKAYSISAINATGPFDILPRHHNFISLLSACELKVAGVEGDKRIRISGGLMQVKSDTVKVFLDV
jgi:F0F1-type ATP synthase epsilon subunit